MVRDSIARALYRGLPQRCVVLEYPIVPRIGYVEIARGVKSQTTGSAKSVGSNRTMTVSASALPEDEAWQLTGGLAAVEGGVVFHDAIEIADVQVP